MFYNGTTPVYGDYIAHHEVALYSHVVILFQSLNLDESTTVQEHVEIKLKDGKTKKVIKEDDKKARKILKEDDWKKISWSDVVKKKDKVPIKV